MKLKTLTFFSADIKKELPLAFSQESVAAGFPSPADDYMEKSLDLNEHLIDHPAATFFVRVEGDSMQDVHIFKGDTLIVDRSVMPTSGKIVIAVINGEFTVKTLRIENQQIYLDPKNSKFPPIKIDPESDFRVWGVVTYIIHKAK